MEKIPIIDLKPLTAQLALLKNVDDLKLTRELLSIGNEIRDALNQIGFFYFINHGIPQDLVDSIFISSKTFFELPDEVKESYKKDESNIPKDMSNSIRTYFGYNKDGMEKLNSTEATWETRQSFDCQESYGRYPNKEIPGFQDGFQSLFRHSKFLVKAVLRLLAVSLELDPDFFIRFSKHLDNPNYYGLENVRMNYYPPVSEKTPPGSIRAAAHSDYVIMTFLFQDKGGLTAQNSSDLKFQNAPPIPGTIFVVTGLVMEYWTKGYFRAAPHRVRYPDDENEAKQPRQSIVYFHGPDEDAVIHPIDVKIKSAVTLHEHPSEPQSAKTICMAPLAESYKGYK